MHQNFILQWTKNSPESSLTLDMPTFHKQVLVMISAVYAKILILLKTGMLSGHLNYNNGDDFKSSINLHK